MNWGKARLRDFCEFRHGGTPSKARDDFWGGEIPWVSPKDMRESTIRDTEDHITRKAVEDDGAVLTPRNSLLVVVRSGILVRSFPVARTAVETSFNQDMKAILVNSSIALPEFVFRFLQAREQQILVQGVKRGATVHSIQSGYIESLTMPLPAPREQRRIVELLEQADGLRRQRAEADQLADRILPALFHKMFGDPIANSKAWPVVSFGEIAESRLGKMLDAKQQTGEHRRPYLRNLNVQWNRFDLSSVLEMDFAPDERDEFLLRKGDLLICEGGEVGRAAIWDESLPECYFQKALHRVRPHVNRCAAEYLLHLLWALAKRGGLIDVNSKATIPHLTGVQLAALKIPLPPVELQKRFARLLQATSTVTTKTSSCRDNIECLFRTMLHRAFTGELTAKWREAHLNELLAEMEQQARVLESQKAAA